MGRVAVAGTLAGDPQGAELNECACMHTYPLSSIFISVASQPQSIPLSSQHSILAQYRSLSLQALAVPAHVLSCAQETTPEETLLFSFTFNFCFATSLSLLGFKITLFSWSQEVNRVLPPVAFPLNIPGAAVQRFLPLWSVG